MADMKSIDAINARMVEVWNRHDMEGFGDLFAESADFVNIFGDLLQGRDHIVTEHTVRHRTMFRSARMTIHSSDVRNVRADIAVVRARWQMDNIQGPDGNPAPSRTGLLMHVMERGTDGWRIIATQNTETPRR